MKYNVKALELFGNFAALNIIDLELIDLDIKNNVKKDVKEVNSSIKFLDYINENLE